MNIRTSLQGMISDPRCALITCTYGVGLFKGALNSLEEVVSGTLMIIGTNALIAFQYHNLSEQIDDEISRTGWTEELFERPFLYRTVLELYANRTGQSSQYKSTQENWKESKQSIY